MNYSTLMSQASLGARISTRFAPSHLHAVDQWEVVRHLGSGSTAHVWLLEHESGRHHVAFKTPKSAEDLVMLSQEAELAKELEHQNIVRLLKDDAYAAIPGLAPDAGTCWEFLPGGSLGSMISAGGPLSVAQTVTVVLPMVQVVQYLHAKHIVHGDISPRNVLFDLTGRPVLIDLGSARATGQAKLVTGTPGFMAPEILETQAPLVGLGASADVYSLAAIAWFSLVGTAPGPPHTRVPLTTLQPDLDHDIVEVLEAALLEEPALRPGMEQLLASVAHWAIPEPVDLYASVGEEYELLLPTRKPRTSTTTGRRSTRNSASTRHQRSPGGSSARSTANRILAQRVFLGLSLFALATGTVLTAIYAPNESWQQTGVHADQAVPDHNTTVDFQQVVDELAKARSAAWALADAHMVADYAVQDSELFRSDTEVLESVAEMGHRLDGIRMRGAVESIEELPEGAQVQVSWRIDGYVQRDASGGVVQQVRSRQDQVGLVLVETPHGWRMHDVG